MMGRCTGGDGPLPIQHQLHSQWTGFTKAVAEAVKPEGLDFAGARTAPGPGP